MVPYSKEFRREVLSACDAGGGTRAVALKFLVSESWVRRIKQERREAGKTAPLLTRRRTPKWAPYQAEIEREKGEIRTSPEKARLSQVNTEVPATRPAGKVLSWLLRRPTTQA